jgi:hypothetical protein
MLMVYVKARLLELHCVDSLVDVLTDQITARTTEEPPRRIVAFQNVVNVKRLTYFQKTWPCCHSCGTISLGTIGRPCALPIVILIQRLC